MPKSLLFVFVALMCFTTMEGQETFRYFDRLQQFKTGEELFDFDNYINARYELQRHLDYPGVPQFENYAKIKRRAQVLERIAGIRLESLEGEHDLIEVIDLYHPDPMVIPAVLELGSFYYNNRRYNEAIGAYEKLDLDLLPVIELSEASFKKGYAYFVQKKFEEAQYEFGRAKEFKNIYYYPNNYYNGMSEYFLGNFSNAIDHFKKVSESSVYGGYIPYYLSQIYFAEKDYDRLISYGEQRLLDQNVKNKKEIRLLLGQAYYVRNNFDRALPHLEYYESHTDKLSVEEFYQLAFTQYQKNQYQKAKENFLELTNENSKLGQLANYYLADCYLKLNDKLSSRAAFKKVSQMDYDLAMKEEATFNYGKMSGELGYDREAINILVDVADNSPYYSESQTIINDILVNSGDYANSIKIMETLPRLTDKLKATYQDLSLKRGLLLYSENQLTEAELYLNKSQKYTPSAKSNAIAQYWIAELYSNKNEYERGVHEYEKFFGLAQSVIGLPEESSFFLANYNQAYNYLKLKDYGKAEVFFKRAIVSVSEKQDKLVNKNILDRVLPDAFIRAGDCLFKLRKYEDAKVYYDQSIEREQAGYVYAIFQKGIIEGLLGDNYSKILNMEEIRAKHKNSEYMDDALMELGDTYIEVQNPDQAASVFVDLIAGFGDKSPFTNTAHLRLGLINYNRGNVNGALGYYKTVIDANPTTQERQEAISAIEEIYLKDLNEADAFIAYLDSIPGFELSAFTKDSLNYSIAKEFYNNAEYQKAENSFTVYLSNYTQGYYQLDALYYRADCNNLQKQYVSANNDYEKIISQGYSNYLERSLLKAAIISYNYTQNFSKALQHYKQYESETKENANIYQAQLGAMQSAFRLGRSSDVLNYSNKVIGNDLASKDEKATAYYYQGKTYLNTENLDGAVNSFSMVDQLAINNQAAESRYLLAEIYFKQGDIEKAEKQCNVTNDKSTNYPFWIAKSLILISDIKVQQADLLNARAALEAVIENFKDDDQLVSIAQGKLNQLSVIEEEENRIKTEDPNILELQKSDED